MMSQARPFPFPFDRFEFPSALALQTRRFLTFGGSSESLESTIGSSSSPWPLLRLNFRLSCATGLAIDVPDAMGPAVIADVDADGAQSGKR